MKWFHKWVAKKHDQYQRDGRYNMTIGLEQPRVTARGMDSHRGMNFSIYNAVGGYVVEYNFYEPNTDRHDRRLHIIADGNELGEGIAHVITNELLRR